MQTIIIEVSGGVVQEVYSDKADIRIILVDWDNGESPGDNYAAGKLSPQPLSAMPSETRGAISNLIQ